MRIAKTIGYDYVESNCRGIADADDALLSEIASVGIPVLAANCFIDMRVIGPDRNDAILRSYLARLFRNAAALGLKTLVFGSAGARRRKPEEGLTEDECRAGIVRFLKELVAPLAERHGMTVAVEPLRRSECNLINVIAQGVGIAERVGSPRVKVLADAAHMLAQNEPMSEIVKHAGWIVHAHTSDGFGDGVHKRLFPAEGNVFDQDGFFVPLTAAGVETCSVEAQVVDFESDAAAAFAVLRKYRTRQRPPDAVPDGPDAIGRG